MGFKFIVSFAKFYILPIFTTRQELAPDNTAYYLILSGLSVLTVLVFVVYKLYNSPPDTAPACDDIQTESLLDLSLGDIEKLLEDAARVEKENNRTSQEKFTKELRKAKSKTIGIQSRTKCNKTSLEDQPARKIMIAKDGLLPSPRTRKGVLNARNKCSESVLGSTDYFPAEQVISSRRRSSSKPSKNDSTPVNHPKRRSLTKVMSSAPKITSTNQATNKTGKCRPKDSNHDMIVPTNQLTKTSIGKRQSAQMMHPYLYKRLVLVKKSTVEEANFQSKPEAKGRSRRGVSKQGSSQTNAAMANITSEPDLRNQEPAFSVNIVKKATWEANSIQTLQETDHPESEVITHAVRDTESSESYDCTVLLPVQSRNFDLSTFVSEENVELCDDKFTRSLSPTNTAPSAARNASLADTSRRNSASPKRRDNPSKARLMKRKSDLPRGLRSSSFNLRKSYDAKCRLQVSSTNVKRAFSDDASPAVEKIGRKESLLDLLEKLQGCEETQLTKDRNSIADRLPLDKNKYGSPQKKASENRKEKQANPQMDGSCSNRRRPKSPVKPNDLTKTNSSMKKSEMHAKSHLQDIVSNLGKPKSAQKGGVVQSIDERQAIEEKHQLKDTVSNKDIRQSVNQEDLASNANRSKKREDEQEKSHLESQSSNQGKPKSHQKKVESTKTKLADRILDSNAKNHKNDSNLGRPKSAQKESVFSAGEKTKECDAKINNNDITSKDRPKSARRQNLSPLAKRKK